MSVIHESASDIRLSTQVSTIPELLIARADECGDHTAIYEEVSGERISYSNLLAQALEVAKGLLAKNIKKGDRVAIWAPNSMHWIFSALGTQIVGAIVVPISTRMKGREAADIIERSGAKHLFIVDEFLGVNYPAMLSDYSFENLKNITLLKQNINKDNKSFVDFLTFGAHISDQEVLDHAKLVTEDDLSDLLFTSGTTGRPKGVMSSHGQTLKAFSVYSKTLGIIPADKYLIVNPFFHSFGYKAGWLTGLISGATILPHAVFNADDIFSRVEQEKVTILPGPPTLYFSMLEHPRLDSADLSSLRVAVTGASTIPPILIERIRNELGCSIVTTAYGLTECGGIATICDPKAPAEVIAKTSGQAIPDTELCIMNPDGNKLPPGEVGEVCLRGFHVMKGYFNDPEATKEAIDANGWLHTGDVGYVDEQGNLTITDRLKDMFIMGGFNCYPAEIEAALYEHPDVAQAAVIGVPDERYGEVGFAFVVLMPGSKNTEESLMAWSRDNMSNYKAPRHFKFLDDLPKNATNKVDKSALREMVY